MANVLITGANRGIGLELARLFRGRDDRVIAVCRKSSPELDSIGSAVVTGVDVGSDGAVDALAGRTGDDPIDVLVLNAAILRRDGLDEIDLAAVREQIEVNALGPLRVVKALLPRLRRGAKIAIVTSRMGSIGDNTSGSRYGYRMSKAALNMAGVSLSIDLRERGVAVVILHPGFVRTGMTGGHGDVSAEESARRLLARIDELTLETTGRFRHANGDPLPW
jgi:NAD(P)-dependent dehydrogenase (short-subunit alcohol dehydrogenase family)